VWYVTISSIFALLLFFFFFCINLPLHLCVFCFLSNVMIVYFYIQEHLYELKVTLARKLEYKTKRLVYEYLRKYVSIIFNIILSFHFMFWITYDLYGMYITKQFFLTLRIVRWINLFSFIIISIIKILWVLNENIRRNLGCYMFNFFHDNTK